MVESSTSTGDTGPARPVAAYRAPRPRPPSGGRPLPYDRFLTPGGRNSQIPPDLVAKSQAIDIIGLILPLIQEKNLVHTSPSPRRSRFESLSLSEGLWFTTKSAGMWIFSFSLAPVASPLALIQHSDFCP